MTFPHQIHYFITAVNLYKIAWRRTVCVTIYKPDSLFGNMVSVFAELDAILGY